MAFFKATQALLSDQLSASFAAGTPRGWVVSSAHSDWRDSLHLSGHSALEPQFSGSPDPVLCSGQCGLGGNSLPHRSGDVIYNQRPPPTAHGASLLVPRAALLGIPMVLLEGCAVRTPQEAQKPTGSCSRSSIRSGQLRHKVCRAVSNLQAGKCNS